MGENHLNEFGLAEGQNIWDLDLGKYLAPDQTQVGINNVATQDERQKYAALTNLINGSTGQELTADGQPINAFKFNQDALKSDLAQKQAEYDHYANTSKGDFFQWANEAQANGTFDPRDFAGGNLNIGGTYWNTLNDASLNQVRNYNRPEILQELATQGSSFDRAFADAVPKYIKWKEDRMSANRKLKKGTTK